MKLRVTYVDGRTVEVTAGPRAQVEVERRFNVAYAAAFDSKKGTPRHEHFYAFAWAALHYSGKEPAEYDDWLGTIEDVEILTADDEAGPTRRDRRPAKSSG